jgi:drug/metabolite transporter (DMT)-like permease
MLGVLAGFTSALFSSFNSRMVRTIPAYTISFYEMSGAFLTLGLFMPFYKATFAPENSLNLLPTGMDWLYMIILAGACSVYAYTAAVELMKKISVFVIQLSLNLEPVYGIIMAVIIFGSEEKMGINFYLGTLIILSAVLAYPFLKKRFSEQVTLNP